MPTYLAYGLSSLVAAGIILIGLRFFLQPRVSAAGYGVPVTGERGAADAFFAVKGIRDITSGLVVVALALTAPAHVVGWAGATTTCAAGPAWCTSQAVRTSGFSRRVRNTPSTRP